MVRGCRHLCARDLDVSGCDPSGRASVDAHAVQQAPEVDCGQEEALPSAGGRLHKETERLLRALLCESSNDMLVHAPLVCLTLAGFSVVSRAAHHFLASCEQLGQGLRA